MFKKKVIKNLLTKYQEKAVIAKEAVDLVKKEIQEAYEDEDFVLYEALIKELPIHQKGLSRAKQKVKILKEILGEM